MIGAYMRLNLTVRFFSTSRWRRGVPPVSLHGDTVALFSCLTSPSLRVVLLLSPPLCSHRVMDPISQRATAEHNIASAGVTVVKDLHSSSIKVSIVAGHWIRGKISFTISCSEPPLTLSENISPLSQMYSGGWFQLFTMPPLLTSLLSDRFRQRALKNSS